MTERRYPSVSRLVLKAGSIALKARSSGFLGLCTSERGVVVKVQRWLWPVIGLWPKGAQMPGCRALRRELKGVRGRLRHGRRLDRICRAALPDQSPKISKGL